MDIQIPEGMSNAALFAAVAGFFAPVVLNLIIQSKWSARWQAVAAFAFSALIGVGSAWLSGAFNGVGIVSGILLAFTVTITAYKGFWSSVTPNMKAATDVVKMSPDESGTYTADESSQ